MTSIQCLQAVLGAAVISLGLVQGSVITTEQANVDQERLETFRQWTERHKAKLEKEEIEKKLREESQNRRQDEDVSNDGITEEQISEMMTGNDEEIEETTASPKTIVKRHASGVEFVHTTINRPGSPLSVTLVENTAGVRIRRAVDNNPEYQWPHKIPYIIDESFSTHGTRYIDILKRSMKYINDNVCVEFIDETANWDKSNPNWFTQTGYGTDAYIAIKAGTGCSTQSGIGSGTGERIIYPCFDFAINAHELLHGILAAHPQQGRIRDDYITVNTDNIRPELRFTYSKMTQDSLLNDFFDPKSFLMYGPTTWSENGLETYTPIRDDIFSSDSGTSLEQVVFYELSQVFQCNEKYCDNDPTDCGLGYFTLVKGKCQCVCPIELDPANDCHTFIEGPSTDLEWPNTPFAVFAGGQNHQCPSGFEPGWFSFAGIWTPRQTKNPVYMPTSGNTMSMPVCEKKTPSASEAEWESWPFGGNYCIIKPVGLDCGGAFGDYTLEFQSLETVQHNGSLGDITVSDKDTTMKICCRNTEPYNMEIELPNAEPFRMIAKGSCPRVRGMREYKYILSLFTTVKNGYGTNAPQYYTWDYELQMNLCYYQPPSYGCSEAIVLDKSYPSTTVETPGFGTAREANKRCFYSFEVPDNAKIRITFDSYDLETNDKVLVKRFHKWEDEYRLDNSNPPHQIVSEKSYLSMTYWAGYDSVENQGLRFTADVIFDEDSCYDMSQRGADYTGDMDMSENYEKCLTWAEASSCSDFPYDQLDALWLFNSGSSCRNPGGLLIQPWCYTYKNGTNCQKRYCDVCNIEEMTDVINGCEDLVQEPDFCNSGVQRFGCSQTCGFTKPFYSKGSCGPPSIPSDGQVVGELKDSYSDGEKVKLQCATAGNTASQNEIVCVNSAWTELDHICDACPAGWVPWGDRCFMYFSTSKTPRDAEASCQYFDTTGTLFQVHELADLQMLREFKSQMGPDYHHGNWLSGELNADGKWYFTNTQTEMTYANWTTDAVTNDMSLNCVKMIAEYQKKYQAGGYKGKHCDNSIAPYICQMNSAGSGCKDKVQFCAEVLAQTPDFCSNAQTVEIADEYCLKSCGGCAVNSKCSAPTSATYSLTSDKNMIVPGQLMTFACNEGFYYVSGDLTRACSASGELLGEELVCSAQPVATDINLKFVRKRLSVLSYRWAVLMNHDNYRIPFNGKVTRWYSYCTKPGSVVFLVYRPAGETFTYVGSNSVTCVKGWTWSYNIPADEQINVLKGDIIGVYSPSWNILSISKCDTSNVKMVMAPKTYASSLTDLQAKEFTETVCVIPSIGARVEPAI